MNSWSSLSSSQLALRSLEDMLNAERRWRQNAEHRAQALAEVLTRLAYELGLGEVLEQTRRTDPRALKDWDALDWMRVFQELDGLRGRDRGAWRHPSSQQAPVHDLQALQQKNQQLQGEVERLQATVATLQAEIQRLKAQNQARPEPKPEPHNQKDREKTNPAAPLGIDFMVQGLSEVDWGTLDLPTMYRSYVRSGGKRWQRGLLMVYLLSRFGVNARIEMAVVLARYYQKSLTSARSWVRKAGAYMAQAGFLVEARLQISKPISTSLAVYRLTDEGRALAQRLGWEPVESEWERLIHLHEGERFEAHTMAVLAVAMHARLRGWQASVMPPVRNATPPDIHLERQGEGWYVEVELSNKDNRSKWEHNAQANGGRVALVTATPDRRSVLVADIKRMGLPGKATDLETLNVQPVDTINQETPFWAEEWS